MAFQWDPAKAAANFAKHRIAFEFAIGVFDGPHWTIPSSRAGEARWMSVGLVEGRFVTVVWTRRNGDIRIISARRSRNEEKSAYRSHHGG